MTNEELYAFILELDGMGLVITDTDLLAESIRGIMERKRNA